MKRSLITFVSARWRLLAVMLVVVLLRASGTRVPPGGLTSEEVAGWLGSRTGGRVVDGDFIWEQGDSALWDRLVGRRIVFIGTVGEATDVYRARVRLSREGRALALADLQNLTSTPDGTESTLVARGTRFAFLTADGIGVRRAALLELEPVRPWSLRSIWALVDPPKAQRWEVVFGKPPATADLELAEEGLILSLGPDKTAAAYWPNEDRLEIAGPDHLFAARAHPLAATLPPPQLGAAVRAYLVAFVREALARTQIASDARPQNASLGWVVPSTDASPPSGFPPKTAGSEHAWTSIGTESGLMSRDAGDGATLVAIDTRRLSLHYSPGLSYPVPSVGPHGFGELPEPAIDSVRAMFWGPPPGVKGGAIAERLPVTSVQGSGFGIAGLSDGSPWLGPVLLESEHLIGSPFLREVMHAEPIGTQSSVCITTSGHLLYAFDNDTSWDELSSVLKNQGCAAAVGFGAGSPSGFATVASVNGVAELIAIDAQMPFADVTTLMSTEYEFFYLAEIESQPAASESPEGWIPVAGKAGDDAVAGLYEQHLDRLGADVTVYSFLPGHFNWLLRAGQKERSSRGGEEFARGLQPFEKEDVVFAIDIGNGRRKRTRGLATNGSVGIDLRKGGGALLLEGPSVQLMPSSRFPNWIGGDASELPLTAEESLLQEDGRSLGSRRLRAAICIHSDGSVLIARSVFDSHEANTTALVDLGCQRVAALDRGTHDDATIWVRGAGELPADPVATHLYASSRQPRQRGKISP